MKIRLYILFVLGVWFQGCDQVEKPSFPMMLIEEAAIDNGVVTLHGEVQMVGGATITEWGFRYVGWGSTNFTLSESKISTGKYSLVCSSPLNSGKVYRAWAYARTADGKIIQSSNYVDFWAP